MVALAACSRPETHLIPAGAQGDIFILPGYRSGVPARREGLSIVFEIPRNRILVTQDQLSSQWHTTNYYYVYPDGKRERLTFEPSTIPRTPQSLADHRKIVWFARTGEMSAVDLPCSVKFAQYYVGTPADLLSRTVDQANAQELALQAFVREHHVCP
jgi:hypothetical protein